MWDGGLGVWGGIPLGVLVGASSCGARRNSVRLMMDAVAPGLLLAQAIGRFGNYWNQELYGRPTSLPWGLRIDQAHQTGSRTSTARPGNTGTTSPTFLYEFIWDLIGVGVLLWVDRRFTIQRPALFALYVAWYTTFRTFEEVLRIDPSQLLPAACGSTSGSRSGSGSCSVAFFIWWQFFHEPSGKPVQKPRAGADRPAHGRPEEPRPVTPLASAE